MLFQNGNLKVRELELEDNYLLAKWLSNPLVLEYYEGRDNPFNIDKVNEKFYNRKKEVIGFIVEYEGQEIGYIQYYQLDETTNKVYGYDGKENIYGTDQFIGETEYWNKGIGKVLVKSMVEYLVEQKQADKVVMDPQTWNERAITCYEKCGFKKIKILSKHEFHEGQYNDCWLVEYKKSS
jgi:aminoglycoside 6'-N-acetyltransferase